MADDKTEDILAAAGEIDFDEIEGTDEAGQVEDTGELDLTGGETTSNEDSTGEVDVSELADESAAEPTSDELDITALKKQQEQTDDEEGGAEPQAKESQKPQKEETPEEPSYNLVITIPDSEPQEVTVEDKLALGSGDDVEISIEGLDLEPKHCVFRVHNDVLTILNLGDETTKIGKQKLKHGKMYILDDGDLIKIKDIEIEVKRDEPEVEEVEEEDGEAEDGEKAPAKDATGKTAKVGLLKRIFGGGKKKKGAAPLIKKKPWWRRKKKAPTSFGQSYSLENAPGPLVRMYAFVANATVAYAVLYFVLPFFQVDQMVLPVINNIIQDILTFTTVLTLIPKELHTLTTLSINFYIFFILVDAITNLLLGTSVPLFILGVSTNDDYAVTKRLKGFFRAIIGGLLLPLVIFDIPLFFNKRTTKETVTMTQFEYKNKIQRIVGLMVLLPALMALCLISPLGRNISFSHKLKLLPTEVKHKSKRKRTKNFKVSSDYFQFNVHGTLSNNIALIPIIRPKKYSKVILLYNIKDSTTAIFRKGESVNLLTAIKLSSSGNPMFSVLYPTIYSVIHSKNKKITFDPELVKELKALTKASFALNLNTVLETVDYPLIVPEYLQDYGPFITGYTSFRDDILNQLQLPYIPNVNLVEVGQVNFVRFSSQGDTSSTSQHIFSLESPLTPIFEITYRKKAKQMADQFLTAILTDSVWNWDKKYSKIRNKRLGKIREWDAFSTIDYFIYSKDHNFSLPSSPLIFYKKLVKMAIDKDQMTFKKHVSKSIIGTVNYLKHIQKRQRSKKIPVLSQKLLKLHSYLKINQKTRDLLKKENTEANRELKKE